MPSPRREAVRRILVVDIGGAHIKVLVTGRRHPIVIPSGSTMTPKAMVAAVRAASRAWTYDVVSIGYPGPVLHGRAMADPHNLGRGWVGFNFAKAFRRPTRIVNDAAMQALGSYRGGRMLFLGLGTGLGSALMVDGVLGPAEFAHLPYLDNHTFEDYVGIRGLKRLGIVRWRAHVLTVVMMLKKAVCAEYVVLGGGNLRLLETLPPGVVRGNNDNAFRGGFRLWRAQVSKKRIAA
jgi:glucose-6-phosphate isomerase